MLDPATLQAGPVEDSQESHDSQATLTLGAGLEREAEAAEMLPAGTCVVTTAEGPTEMQHPAPEPAIAEGVVESIWAVDQSGVCHAVVVARKCVAATWHDFMVYTWHLKSSSA